RGWLAHNQVPNWRERMAADPDGEFEPLQRAWLARLESVGQAVPHWPVQWGGEGLSIREQVVCFEEFARAETLYLSMFSISHYHVPATLYAWGTPGQVATYVPAARKGQVWCQGFSEPNAGSDLASLRTRAERKGDRYVINGQKIWSSGGMYADLYMLLARTDPKVPKHAGISMLIVDLKSKGVDVRPIKQINGSNEFCEMFLDDVEVPMENLIGPENQGWKVSQ